MPKKPIALAVLLAFSVPSFAEQLATDPNAQLTLGVSAGYTAEAYKMDNTLSVLPYGFYDNNRLYLEGGEGGAYLYKDKTHQLRAGLGYDGRSFDPADADTPALKTLNKRKVAITAQAQYMAITPVGGIRAKVAKNLGHDGTALSLAYVSRFEFGKATIYPSFGATWHDKDYNRYYYGISAQESAKSGLATYTPSDGVSPFVSLTVMYDLTDKIGIMGSQKVDWLSKEQKNSPMADDKFQSTTRIGISYKF